MSGLKCIRHSVRTNHSLGYELLSTRNLLCGFFQFYINRRELDKLIVMYFYPLPRIDYLINSLSHIVLSPTLLFYPFLSGPSQHSNRSLIPLLTHYVISITCSIFVDTFLLCQNSEHKMH